MKKQNKNKDDENKGSLKESVGPLVGNALKSGQLLKPEAGLTEAEPDILVEYDVKIPISEGYNLTANIYRSKTAAANGEKVPVVMCAHPYNNNLTPALKNTPFNGPPQQYRMIPQAGKPVFSELTSWESPDPNFWVPEGYAIVNMNLPGYATSEGPPTAFSESQGKAYYEAIEWVAKPTMVYWQSGPQWSQFSCYYPVPRCCLSILWRSASFFMLHLSLGRTYRCLS